MRDNSCSEPPHDVAAAIAFAHSLASSHAARGGNMIDLFAGFAGAVSAQNKQVAADCLKTLDTFMEKTASL